MRSAALRAPVVRYLELPDGEEGTVQVLGLMRELARRGATSPLIRRGALHSVGQQAGTPQGARAIRVFLERHARFFPDPPGLELVQTPELQMERIRSVGYVCGDCDDIAVLGAALGLAAGFPTRFVVLAFDPSGPWEHVYTELQVPGGWVELDTSREAQRVPPGFRPDRVATFDL